MLMTACARTNFLPPAFALRPLVHRILQMLQHTARAGGRGDGGKEGAEGWSRSGVGVQQQRQQQKQSQEGLGLRGHAQKGQGQGQQQQQQRQQEGVLLRGSGSHASSLPETQGQQQQQQSRQQDGSQHGSGSRAPSLPEAPLTPQGVANLAWAIEKRGLYTCKSNASPLQSNLVSGCIQTNLTGCRHCSSEAYCQRAILP